MTSHRGGSCPHGGNAQLKGAARGVLERGLAELLRLREGREFRDLPSEKHPFPLARVAYASMPDAGRVREDAASRMRADPVGALDQALALFELHACSQPGVRELVPDDMALVRACFASKRCNGWTAFLGDSDRDELESAIGERWQFRFFRSEPRELGLYVLLNMLARYAYVYGRVAFGDVHSLQHFVAEHCPGLVVCRGKMSDLELALSLMAMKMGVPAIVPEDYPFHLGKTVRADGLDDIVEAVALFPNIRRLLATPEVPGFPDYCNPENRSEKFGPAATWGGTPDSFYIVRKGKVRSSDVVVKGRSEGAVGIVVTIDAEPMDAFDRRYMERRIIGSLSMMRGVSVQYESGELLIHQAKDANLDPARIGKVLTAAVRHEFPRLKDVRVEVIFDEKRLKSMSEEVRREKEEREREIGSATEESADRFYSCVGCSPFAPDHVCILTPERPPQCARPYEMIKTGALYGYDDMSNIHHSSLHRDMNSFGAFEKGRCIDPERGEWEGVNAQAAKLTHGRTRRVLLHSLDEAPHTGCGCYRLIMFKTDEPRPGVGIMDPSYEGCAPDGRRWKDLYYDLAGKQCPGVAGCSPGYLPSRKFLRGHGGWGGVVWVSPTVAGLAGDRFPGGTP